MQNNLATLVNDDEEMNEATTEFVGRVYSFPQRALPGATDAIDDLAVIRSQVDSRWAQLRILATNPMDIA